MDNWTFNMRKKIIFLSIFTSIFFQLQAKDSNSSQKKLYNPSNQVQVNKEKRLIFSADFLYWIAQENGLLLAQGGTEPGTSERTESYDYIGDLYKVKPDWQPGFRLCLGYKMPHDKWDSFLNWTFYQTSKNNTANNSLMTAVWGHSHDLGNKVNAAQGKWSMHFNTIDLLLGRDLLTGKYLSLKPCIGIKGSLIPQNLKIDYTFPSTPTTNANMKVKSNFYGAGPTINLNTLFSFNENFGIYGQGALALLYGKFDSGVYLVNQTETASSIIVDSKNKFTNSIGAAQLLMGLTYSSYISNKSYFLRLKLGWEQNIFYGINKMFHYLHSIQDSKAYQKNGNLTLQGLTCNISLDF